VTDIDARRSDWVMRMRFWSEITREDTVLNTQMLSARAFRPKARSHDPVTPPQVCLNGEMFHHNKL